ncbi:hypothetical protein CEE69_17425 [Rhodopirellula bahusiensis]|uniref:Uncharacterized protein n=1 Tax=Rhodopirellula bahusiensis TaxID=2014065 RepID=A0A2G1W4X2_9BACT|nr:hypothetical protein CEE69_17425 [Rhodopirellula bahusiensis]
MKKTLGLRLIIIAGWATAVMVGVKFLRKFWLIFAFTMFGTTHWCDSMSRSLPSHMPEPEARFPKRPDHEFVVPRPQFLRRYGQRSNLANVEWTTAQTAVSDRRDLPLVLSHKRLAFDPHAGPPQ